MTSRTWAGLAAIVVLLAGIGVGLFVLGGDDEPAGESTTQGQPAEATDDDPPGPRPTTALETYQQRQGRGTTRAEQRAQAVRSACRHLPPSDCSPFCRSPIADQGSAAGA